MTEEDILKKEQELALREFNLDVWTAREKQEHSALNLTQTQSIRKVVKVLAEEHFCAKEKEIATIIANGESTLALVRQIIEDRKEQEKVHREEKDKIADNLKEFNGTIRTAIENLAESNKKTFEELFKGRNDNKEEITKIKTTYKVAMSIIGFLYLSAISAGAWAFDHILSVANIIQKISNQTGGTP